MKTETITITLNKQSKTRTQKIEAERVAKDFYLHRRVDARKGDKDVWTITYAPKGYLIGPCFRSKAQARTFARTLRREIGELIDQRPKDWPEKTPRWIVQWIRACRLNSKLMPLDNYRPE